MFNKIRTTVMSLALATTAGAVQAETYDFSVFLPEPFPLTKAETHFANAFDGATDGAVSFNITYGGALGGSREMLDFVANGVVGGATFAASEYTAQFPAAKALDMPMLYKDDRHAAALYEKMFDEVEGVRQRYLDLGVVPFLFRGLDPYQLLCNKKVETLDDFKGLKIRSFGNVYPMMFQELGAVPIVTGSGEVYEAMQRGTVDCAVFSAVSHLVFKVHEVAEYEIDFPFGAISGYLVYINKDLYDGLSDAQKEAIAVAEGEAEVIAEKALNGLIGAARKTFDAKLEQVAFQDGDKLHEMFPPSRMIDLYVEDVSQLGAAQAEIANRVADFLRAELVQ